MTEKRITVSSATGPYPVAYAQGIVRRAAAEIAALGENTGVYLLLSPRVARCWRKPVESALRYANLRATIVFDDREAKKNMPTVEQLCRHLVKAGADRRAVIVAVGGGVVGDVCGFVAASYLRGVRLVHVPTTVVAQVDSAIGGKTGVNLPEGKNLVGAFYPPHLVLADPSTLKTLPPREFRSGIYEVVKYGVIGDPELFAFLEKNIEKLVQGDSAALDYVIPRCIQAKADIVGRDERESGLREILNFGHTFAHAFETATKYRRYLHGEAVGWGMIAAARLGTETYRLAGDEAARIEKLVRRVGPLPPLLVEASKVPQRLVKVMGSDKKTRGGQLRFVLADRIGHAETVPGIPVDAVCGVLVGLHRTGESAK